MLKILKRTLIILMCATLVAYGGHSKQKEVEASAVVIGGGATIALGPIAVAIGAVALIAAGGYFVSSGMAEDVGNKIILGMQSIGRDISEFVVQDDDQTKLVMSNDLANQMSNAVSTSYGSVVEHNKYPGPYLINPGETLVLDVSHIHWSSVGEYRLSGDVSFQTGDVAGFGSVYAGVKISFYTSGGKKIAEYTFVHNIKSKGNQEVAFSSFKLGNMYSKPARLEIQRNATQSVIGPVILSNFEFYSAPKAHQRVAPSDLINTYMAGETFPFTTEANPINITSVLSAPAYALNTGEMTLSNTTALEDVAISTTIPRDYAGGSTETDEETEAEIIPGGNTLPGDTAGTNNPGEVGNIDENTGILSSLFSWLKDILVRILNAILGLPQLFADAIADAFDWLKGLLDSIWSAIQALPGLIVTGISAAFEWTKGILDSIWSAIQAVPGAIVTGISAAFEWTKGILDSIWSAIQAVPGAIVTGISAAFEWLKGILDSIWSAIQAVPGAIVTGISTAFDWLKGILDSVIGGIQAIPGAIAAIFVPVNMSNINTQMGSLQGQFDGKFGYIGDFTSNVSNIFAQKRSIYDLRIDLKGHTYPLIPISIKPGLDAFRAFLTGCVVLFGYTGIYRRIKGNGDLFDS